MKASKQKRAGPDENRQQDMRDAHDDWFGVQEGCDALISFTASNNPFVRYKLERAFRRMRPSSTEEMKLFLTKLGSFFRNRSAG